MDGAVEWLAAAMREATPYTRALSAAYAKRPGRKGHAAVRGAKLLNWAAQRDCEEVHQEMCGTKRQQMKNA